MWLRRTRGGWTPASGFVTAPWRCPRRGKAKSQRSRCLGGGFAESMFYADHREVPVRQVGLAAQCHRDSAGAQFVRLGLAFVAQVAGFAR